MFIRFILKIFKLKESLMTMLTTKIIKFQSKSLGVNCKFSYPVSILGLNNITIGNNVKTGPRMKLRTFSSWKGKKYNPILKIGNNVNLESDCHISAINKVEIEDDVLIASFVYISDHSHGEINPEILKVPPLERPLTSKGPIRICNNVWIGEKVSILSGVTIGEGSIIGANSVVTKNIPPFCIAAGCPAKIIKKLR